MAVKHGSCAYSEKIIQTLETKCLRKLLCISYLEHKTNDWVRSNINLLVGPQEPLLVTVERRNLSWFGPVTRRDNLSKTILQGTSGGWATPWSAKEVLGGQHQRVDLPAHARTAHNDLLHKTLEETLF